MIIRKTFVYPRSKLWYRLGLKALYHNSENYTSHNDIFYFFGSALTEQDLVGGDLKVIRLCSNQWLFFIS